MKLNLSKMKEQAKNLSEIFKNRKREYVGRG